MQMMISNSSREDVSITKDNVEYYLLYAACPDCLRGGRPSVPAYWHHNNCGGKMYIGDNAFVYCENCGETIPLVNCRFLCPECQPFSNGHFIERTDIKYIGTALAMSGMFCDCGLVWLNRITKAIIQQCKDE